MAQAEIKKTYNDIGLGGPIKTFLNDTLWLQVVADMHSETGIYFFSSLWKCRRSIFRDSPKAEKTWNAVYATHGSFCNLCVHSSQQIAD
ncbi:hypothetical protein ACP70R_040363 [Stipagrostis hirtigluma subsp. patula]